MIIINFILGILSFFILAFIVGIGLIFVPVILLEIQLAIEEFKEFLSNT